MIDSLRQDVKSALRSMRLNPAFSAVAILSLALGAGANTAMFQLLDAVRLRVLPVAQPRELVDVRLEDMTHARGAWLREGGLTNPLWERIRDTQDTFAAAFAWADETLDVSTSGDARRIAGLWVSGGFFPGLGIQPAAGRLLTPADDKRGCGTDAPIVLSYRFWQQEFGGDPSIAGKAVAIGKLRRVVAGVAPRDFFGLEVGRTFDVALPLCAEAGWHGAAARLDSGTVWWLTVMARLRPDTAVSQAAAEMRGKSAGIFEATLPAAYPAASVKPYLNTKLVVSPAANGISRVRAAYSRPLVLLFAITALVLLIAAVNLAHLMLARTSGRRRELAVRAALGASGRRLAQQLITEGFVLAAAGAAAGLIAARWLSRFLVSLLTADASNVFLDLSTSGRTLAFAALLAVVVCLVFAVVPARRAARRPPSAGLGPNTRLRTSTRAHGRTRRVLLSAQIAVSLALLMGTLLFVQTLRNLRTLDPGFQLSGLTIADVNFSDLQLSPDRAVAFRHGMLERIRGIAGVGGAVETLILPLAGGNWNNRIWMDGSDPSRARVVMRNMIGPGYFHTFSTPLVAGREFDDRDLTASAARVAIVNEQFARQFGLGAAAVGRRFSIESTPLEPSASYEIVGVAGNTKYRDLREQDLPIVYVPLWQSALRRPSGQFIIRSTVGRDSLAASLRQTFDGLGKVRYSVRSYDAVVEDALVRERLMATMAGPFGTLALVLAVLGLYGVLSYLVTRQTREIGIRIALGASRRDVIAPILREAGLVVFIGLAAGVLLTVAGSRAAQSLLFGVRPSDPALLIVACAVLAAVAAVAAYLPARRAASVDPIVALRQE